MKRLAVSLAPVVVLALGAGPTTGVRAAPINRVRAGVARNWAGYVAFGGPYTSASTTWSEPSVRCAAQENSSAAIFAGIDGAGSTTVEQIGTFANCRNGRVTHHPFYEMYPTPASPISKPVRAGDSLTANVVASAPQTFTLTLVDHTANWTFSTQQRSTSAQLASAEAIVEAPTLRGSGIQPLANFRRVQFGGTTANGQPIGSLGAQAFTMETSSGVVRAAPSSLAGGTSFSVVWRHA